MLCDGSRMRTTIHYVVVKPDSRPDGTAIRDHARLRVYTRYTRAQRAMAMAEAMDDAVAVIEEVGDNTEDQLSLEVC